MRYLVPLLIALVVVPVLHAQDATVAVLFDRSTPTHEAYRLLYDVAPGLVHGAQEFPPLVLGRQLNDAPSAETLIALFASGATSVKVTSERSHLIAFGVDVESLKHFGDTYLVAVEYASTVPTFEASAAFEAVLGGPPASVTKGENLLRLALPVATVPAVAEQIQAIPAVVAVRVES